MGGLLVLFAFIVLFFIGKFIYDSYLTDNTEKNWQRYQAENQLRGSENEKFKTSNHQVRQLIANKYRSLNLMAKSYDCEGDKIKEFFFNEIENDLNFKPYEIIIEDLRSKKLMEAKVYGFHENDTPSGIKEKWLLDFMQEETSNIIDYEKALMKVRSSSQLKLMIERMLRDAAKKQIEENNYKDNVTLSMFVIHEIESLASELESRLVEKKERFGLSENQISVLVKESTGIVMRDLFKQYF